ncbi:hypothetical protein Q765_07375 [Flavobacterium rivuli WB 3.3-2 = DSM 21788]|uniref:Uncharacterized protein n=1 Tax=Flavobacterium rivuli WB 3.3-2 = DSM 21788 TaxID=1121895 RepID=A0A0A2M761_9FLAO|nr:hypothetical protein [Flavobacterium rivuli]KGO87476.1 hypothetical protein Q765_07375 [Flavobacterium rivuli WB 3.3-2 = DSM 21788]
MNTNTIITLLSIFLPLIGAAIGYLFKYSIEKKKEITNEITKERRILYQQYVNLVIDIFADSKIGKAKTTANLMKELYDFYKKYVLYASPSVIKAFSNYFQHIYKPNENADTKKTLEFMTKIMVEMRKDLGLKNDGLGGNGEMLMRALITDYDTIWK